MKTIGILAFVAAIFATASIADAAPRHHSNDYGYSEYTGYDRAGGPSYGGM